MIIICFLSELSSDEEYTPYEGENNDANASSAPCLRNQESSIEVILLVI